MIGIIWTPLGSFERKQAEEQLEKICKDYPNQIEEFYKECLKLLEKNIIRKIKYTRMNQFSVTFDNGDRWSIVYARPNARGRRCNVSYIHRNISQDIVKDIIVPITFRTPPYHAFYVYGG